MSLININPAEIITFESGDPAETPWVTTRTPRKEEIEVQPYSRLWPELFKTNKSLIAAALPGIAVSIEHIGSTAVPSLSAKPVIDIDLIVPNPDEERDYVSALTAIGYVLTVRERSWYKHRMFCHAEPRANLHVFGPGCAEHIRHILFRDWLCDHPADASRYGNAKLTAKAGVDNVQDYNRNKEAVVRDIYRRIFQHHGWIS